MSEDRKLLRHNFYSFHADNRRYGVDIGFIREVKEILSADEIAPLPHAAPSVLGYVNVRGAIHQVLSLEFLFGSGAAAPVAGGMIIYCKDSAATATGIYCARAGEMIQLSEKDIDRWEGKRPEDGASWADFLSCGACRHGGEVMTLLDPRRIYQAALEHNAR